MDTSLAMLDTVRQFLTTPRLLQRGRRSYCDCRLFPRWVLQDRRTYKTCRTLSRLVRHRGAITRRRGWSRQPAALEQRGDKAYIDPTRYHNAKTLLSAAVGENAGTCTAGHHPPSSADAGLARGRNLRQSGAVAARPVLYRTRRLRRGARQIRDLGPERGAASYAKSPRRPAP